jgi:hypothetical protein
MLREPGDPCQVLVNGIGENDTMGDVAGVAGHAISLKTTFVRTWTSAALTRSR